MKNSCLLLVMLGFLYLNTNSFGQTSASDTGEVFVSTIDNAKFVETQQLHRYYFNFGTSYGFDNQSDIHWDYKNETSSSGEYFRDAVSTSCGSGFALHAGFGKKISNTVSLELNIKFLFNPETVQNYYSDYDNSRLAVSSFIFSATPTINIDLPKITPKTTPFIKLGLSVAIPHIYYTEDYTYSTYDWSYVYKLEWTEKGNVALGYEVQAGLRFKLSEAIDFTVGVAATAMNYKPAKLTYTKVTHNGGDVTSYFPEIKYVTSYRSEGNTSPQVSRNLSSIGIQAGLRFVL
jgi:hypothetical protein